MADDMSISGNIQVDTGNTFQLSLKSNPTTGYSWAVEHMPEGVCLLNMAYSAGHPVMPGSGGTQVFTFGSLSAGQGYLKFIYIRPWEMLEPADTKTYSVVVE